HKLGFKNFYSRGSSDEFRQSIGVNGADFGQGVTTVNYQLRFVERFVGQSQLTGDHYLPRLLRSRIEWKASLARAARGDLDNRTLTYTQDEGGTHLSLNRPFYRTNPRLADHSWSGQLDWSFPFRLRTQDDALIKFGGAYRRKSRVFRGTRLRSDISANLVGTGILELPPEQLFAPENVGPGGITYVEESGTVNPYTGVERVAAGFGVPAFER